MLMRFLLERTILVLWLVRNVTFVDAFSVAPARAIGRSRHSNQLSSPRGYNHGSMVTAVSMMDSGSFDSDLSSVASPTLLLGVALFLGVAANGWIQRLLQGDRGLSSFLSDGAGFNKSRFQPLRKDDDRAVQSDPLPWLRLPQLDFVEVAGQGNDDVILKLEELRLKLAQQIENGNMDDAKETKLQMEALMNESGVQFLEDGR